MSRIQTITPQQAVGDIKTAYDHFIKGAGQVPKPLEMFSISPELFKIKTDTIRYYGRSNLSFPLLTLIRYLTAEDCHHEACSLFNRNLAKRQGMTDEELSSLRQDPGKGPLEDHENQLLAFVVKAVKNPAAITEIDITKLKEEGWSEKDIFEAVNHGADMVSSAILMKVFQID